MNTIAEIKLCTANPSLEYPQKPPEDDVGNSEYKLILTNCSKDKLEKIKSQMRYRVEQGNGEAFYTLGVADDGKMLGLTEDELSQSKKVLETAAKECSFSISTIVETSLPNLKKTAEFLIREQNIDKYQEIKVAIVGNVDAGKSSLLSTLIFNQLDNGRGEARNKIFNFKHEISTGRTSSVAHHILGFSSDGSIVNHQPDFGHKLSWPEIVKQSCKIISFFDLAGHEKYLRTTISSLTTQIPHLAIILVGANMGIKNPMTQEHIGLCLTLHIPFIIVITKIDICEERKNVLEETINDTKALLKTPVVSRIPIDIHSNEDVLLAVKNIYSLSSTPIFYVSNVTGEGHNFLKTFLNILPIPQVKKTESKNKVEMYIDQIFRVKGIGIVISGQLLTGQIDIGDSLIIGPNNGIYTKVQVKSIHCKRVSVQTVNSGCYICLAIKIPIDSFIRKGNIVLSSKDRPIGVKTFVAKVRILKTHSTSIKKGYTPMIFTCGVRQTCKIVEIMDKQCYKKTDKIDNSNTVLRNGDKATIKFEFGLREEFIKPNSQIFLSEGKVKIIGQIESVDEIELKVL